MVAKVLRGAAAAMVGLALATGAAAAEEPAAADDWAFEAGLYLWAPVSVEGTSTLGPVSAPVDLDLSDVLDLLEFVGSGRIEAWRGRFGFALEGYYVDLGSEVSRPLTDIDVDIQQGIIDLTAGYRFGAADFSANGGSIGRDQVAFDLLAGGRYNYLKQKIKITPGPNPGGSESWIEPLIGGRVVYGLSEDWALIGRADASGFSVGDGSDLTWNLWGMADYHPWEKWSLRFGYRYYSIDYETGSGLDTFGYDVEQHGPVIAGSYRF